MTSEHCHDQLWDYVYGLLDDAEAAGVRAHVEICPTCQVALSKVQAGQLELARAARAVPDVPLFTIPGQAAAPAAATLPAPATLPLAPASTPAPAPAMRHPRRRRYWLSIAAAAALVALTVGLDYFYQSDRQHYEAQVAQVRGDIAAFDGRFAALRSDLEKDTLQKARQLREETPPIVQLLGPPQVQTNTTTNFNIAVRDMTGAYKAATVTTKLFDPKTNVVLHKQVDRVVGKGNVQIPPVKLHDQQARVVVEARAEKADARLAETLGVAEPVQTSFLALNKVVYAIGDVLFFRGLTVDRFNLKPPAQPVPLRYALVDDAGRTRRELSGQTNAGGISGGELALTPDLPSGVYELQVGAAPGSKSQVIPQTRRLEILRGDTPQIAFDRDQYKPGDKLGVNLRAGQAANSYANQKVNISVIADNQSVPQAAAALSAKLDRAGNLNNFQLQLPPQIKNGAEVVIDVKDGAKLKKLVQAIPVVPSEKIVDFFPEGGDLVAGVPNRVYYRVRSPQGDFVQPEGHVIVLASKAVLHDSEIGQGLGVFTFTPDPAETYSVRITGPNGVTEIAKPFQTLGIQRQGLVLHAQNTVSRQDEPLPITVYNQGTARRVLLQTICRGQSVDQQYVNLPPGSKEIKLQPAPGSAGVLRVTALEVAADRLIPIAERLLFRMPEKRLAVDCRLAAGPGPYAAGAKATLKLNVTDEHQHGGPTWMLVAVVDDKYLADKTETSLATHFYLADDLGDDLDGANLALNDTQASRQALDLFLGTHGWRRFVPGPATPLAELNEKIGRAGNGPGAPAANALAFNNTRALNNGFFSAQNTTAQTLQGTYRAALQQEVGKLVDQANQKRAKLAEQKDASVQLLDEAARELTRFQALPWEYGRIALGVVALALLALGGVLVAFGLVRLVRRKDKSPTALFAGAFTCLGICLILYLSAGQLPQRDVGQAMAKADAPRSAWPVFSAEALNGMAEEPREQAAPTSEPSLPPQGIFYAQGSAQRSLESKKAAPATAALATQTGPEMLAKRSDWSRARGLSQNTPWMPVADAARRQARNSAQGNAGRSEDEMTRRYDAAASQFKERENALGKVRSAPVGAPAFGGRGGFGTNDALAPNAAYGYLREYAYRGSRRSSPFDAQDTLLWSPKLFSADGQAEVPFNLSYTPGTYRILIYANSPTGRLGFYEGHLEVK